MGWLEYRDQTEEECISKVCSTLPAVRDHNLIVESDEADKTHSPFSETSRERMLSVCPRNCAMGEEFFAAVLESHSLTMASGPPEAIIELPPTARAYTEAFSSFPTSIEKISLDLFSFRDVDEDEGDALLMDEALEISQDVIR